MSASAESAIDDGDNPYMGQPDCATCSRSITLEGHHDASDGFCAGVGAVTVDTYKDLDLNKEVDDIDALLACADAIGGTSRDIDAACLKRWIRENGIKESTHVVNVDKSGKLEKLELSEDPVRNFVVANFARCSSVYGSSLCNHCPKVPKAAAA